MLHAIRMGKLQVWLLLVVHTQVYKVLYFLGFHRVLYFFHKMNFMLSDYYFLWSNEQLWMPC